MAPSRNYTLKGNNSKQCLELYFNISLEKTVLRKLPNLSTIPS